MSAALRFGRLVRLVGILGVLCAAGVGCQAQSPLSLEFIADLNVATGVAFEDLGSPEGRRSGSTSVDNTPRAIILDRKAAGGFGGISALAYDVDSQLLYALSDSSNPIVFVSSLAIVDRSIQIEPRNVIRLADGAGVPLPLWILDPEGLAITPEGFLVSSEGYPQRDPRVDPGVFRFDRQGHLLGNLPVPPQYLPRGIGAEQVGVQSNEGFESLSLSPDGKSLYVATETSLAQEKENCSAAAGCRVRVLQYAMENDSGRPVAEYFYRTDPSIAAALGLTEILLLDDKTMLTLERGYEKLKDGSFLQTIRIYQASLPPQPGKDLPVLAKRLVLDLDSVKNQFQEGFKKLDNFEGMCLGPRLPSGERTLLVVSDNNYNDQQRTSLLAFRLIEN